MGWAAGMLYSAATARNWLCKGGVTQRLCAAPSSRLRSHVPTHCSFSHAGSPAPPWVAGSPVAFPVATPRWPPTAALPVWTFGWAREGRHLVSSGGLVPARTCWTHPEQHEGRLSHDRTTERHWQRLGSHRKYVPWSQHTRGSQRHVSQSSCCAIILSSFAWWSSTRLTERHSDATAACIVMERTGSAGGSVKKSTATRVGPELHAKRRVSRPADERSAWKSCAEASRHSHLMSAQCGFSELRTRTEHSRHIVSPIPSPKKPGWQEIEIIERARQAVRATFCCE